MFLSKYCAKMKFFVAILLVFVLVECKHTFMGTSVLRPMIYHQDASYNAKVFQKRIEYINFTMPNLPAYYNKRIQGILAYDLTNTGASCNVTEGGIGMNFVKLRMKSDRGEKMHFDIYVYA